jgi:TolB-like protein
LADSIFIELKKRNVFKVGLAYLVMSWMVVQITATAVPAFNMPGWVNTVVFFFGIVGFPFALFFAWAFEITPGGVIRESEIIAEDPISTDSGRKLNFIIFGLMTVALSYFIYESRFTSEPPHIENSADDLVKKTESPDAQTTSSVLSIAVLPFANMSSDPEQEYFVDGLTEELLNGLTRIKGLKVAARTTSFAYKGKNIDIREIGKKLDVHYLVEGSVRKSGEDIRITMQLIEASSGEHVLSETFDRKLVNIFALQEEISEQVASALKLTLVHKDERYNSALANLDYIAVEQLVTARALVSEYNATSIQKALTILEPLKQSYPNTPEIMGLSVFAAMMQASVGELRMTIQQMIALAEQTLVLDNKNYDALDTLASIYDEYPETYTKAKDIYKELIRFYPANLNVYYEFLEYLISTSSNCEAIHTFLKSIPNGLLTAKPQQEIEFMVSHCLTPDIAAKTLAKMDDKTIAGFSYQQTSSDAFFLIAKKWLDENPNQRYLAANYSILLSMGAQDEAADVLAKIDLSKKGFWSVETVLASYINDIKQTHTPLHHLPSLEILFNNTTPKVVAIGLAMQAENENKTDLLQNYLTNVHPFPISIATNNDSIGLTVLQYYAGEHALSQQTATELFTQLTRHKKEYPASFTYWNLQTSYLQIAFYSQNEALAQTILDNDFPSNYEYWGDDYNAVKFMLKPWKNHPVVIEYLQRIKADQTRAREKFGLNI